MELSWLGQKQIQRISHINFHVFHQRILFYCTRIKLAARTRNVFTISLHKERRYSEFSQIPYSVWMQENTDQNNSEYRHISRNVWLLKTNSIIYLHHIAWAPVCLSFIKYNYCGIQKQPVLVKSYRTVRFKNGPF